MTLAVSSSSTPSGDAPAALPDLYLMSPAGAIPDPDCLILAQKQLAALGYRSTLDPDATARHQRFAGTDAQRLDALERSLAQPAPVVMATRGGYGMGRLLDHIDWSAVAASGKCFVGHSDFTAFHLALLAHTGKPSLAGPMARADFAVATPNADMRQWMQAALLGQEITVGFDTPAPLALDATGVCWGGNLALVSALLGTKHWPEVDGGILFLEDVNEAPYRVERMLLQLLQAGVLGRQQAIVLGDFTDGPTSAFDAGYDLDVVREYIQQASGVPVLRGLPFGHVPRKLTLPVGCPVRLQVQGKQARLHLAAWPTVAAAGS